MTSETFFKLAALVSPFVAAGLGYFLSISTKKKEYLYQNRIPAFKEVAKEIIELKKYLMGKIALHQGNEYSPYFDIEGSALMFRSKIADARLLNEVFLTNSSKADLSSLDATLRSLCNFEVHIHGSNMMSASANAQLYQDVLTLSEHCLRSLYKEIGLSGS